MFSHADPQKAVLAATVESNSGVNVRFRVPKPSFDDLQADVVAAGEAGLKLDLVVVFADGREAALENALTVEL